ncbi:ABC transporter permease subunit [Thermoactinospora rubra]|uniref:ABC transporter permease subunit n=1 Tax=Thermoactinospora rubra TaxID=1088767 RepID=UPI000A10BA62|nr:ABC transporter permease subunit [Thermoactinospora rubra]
MSAGAAAPYRSRLPAARERFAHLVRAEWTKFRTVRGWVAGAVAATLLTVALGLVIAAGSHSSCGAGPVETACPAPPLGPGGQAVEDRFFFLHRRLEGDGAITARLTAMSGVITYPPPGHDRIVSGLVPWAKAGVMVKAAARPGAPYAAVMLTGRHGVRMQHDFTEDVAGRPGGVSQHAPRWLRLVRAGDTLTGYESADGRSWSRIGTAQVAGLTAAVEVGLFVASPGDLTVKPGSAGGSIVQARFTQASAVFDHLAVEGRTAGAWQRTEVGDDEAAMTDWERFHRANGAAESGGVITVTGTGDIAPRLDGLRTEMLVTGALPGLIVVIVVAVLFVTAEYRRGLIRTTLLAGPRRGRMLAAKALVVGAVALLAGLVAAAVVLPAGQAILRGNGVVVLPVPQLTQARVALGLGALLGLAAVLAMALGALFRRSVAAVVAAIAAVVLPYVLATASVLPEELAQWLLGLTPAAGFAILQSLPRYPQVTWHYAPAEGFYPLPPWAGLAVLAGYAALALGLAAWRLRGRDT